MRQLSRNEKYLIFGILLLVAVGIGGWIGHLHRRRHPRALIALPFRGPQMSCDVLVVGGTPSGVAAALAAARHGAKVILVEERPRLGGDIVYAMLNMFDVPIRKDGSSPVAQGVFGEVFQKLGLAFDIVDARKLFEAKIAEEPNIHLLTRVKLAQVLKRGKGHGYVVGARFRRLNSPDEPLIQVNARCTVDSTNDASFATLAGAHSWLGRKQSGIDSRMQAAGLLFSVTDVNWNKMRAYVRSVKLVPLTELKTQSHASLVATPAPSKLAFTDVQHGAKWVRRRLGGGSGGYIWERGEIIRNYIPRGRDVVVLSVNFGRQRDGSVVLNTLNAVNVNGLDWKSELHGRQELTRELKTFLPYLRLKMPGMQQARLKLIAPMLYIRETRHIQGFYNLQVEDIRAQRTFPDAVARVSYPIDLHPYTKGDHNPYGARRYFYTLPLRSLVPQSVDGVFVASRSLSATYSAAGSARVIPTTMAAGQACGVAAWLCASQDTTPQQMAQTPAWWSTLQDELHSDGITTEALPAVEPTTVKPEPTESPTHTSLHPTSLKPVTPVPVNQLGGEVHLRDARAGMAADSATQTLRSLIERYPTVARFRVFGKHHEGLSDFFSTFVYNRRKKMLSYYVENLSPGSRRRQRGVFRSVTDAIVVRAASQHVALTTLERFGCRKQLLAQNIKLSQHPKTRGPLSQPPYPQPSYLQSKRSLRQ